MVIVALPITARAATSIAAHGSGLGVDGWTAATLDAFADTLIPGEKRYPGDTAVAGVTSGPSGASVGYLTLLTTSEAGIAPGLSGVAALLNARASAYAITRGILLTPWRPAFVALSFSHRSTVVAALFQPSDPDRDIWSVMSLMSSLAFDAAAHMPTRDAAASPHPGLAWLRFPAPGADGLWRYNEHSYGRVLADSHPLTTTEGHPA